MLTKEQIQNAEDEYFRLRGQYVSRRITKEEFDTALKQLMLQDEGGRYWMIAAETGKWHVYEGGTWVEADPLGGLQPQTVGPRSRLPIIALASVLVVLIALGGFLLASSQGLVNIANVFSSPRLVTVITATPAATNTPIPPTATAPATAVPPVPATTAPTVIEQDSVTPTPVVPTEILPSPTAVPATPSPTFTAPSPARLAATLAPSSTPKPTEKPTEAFAPGVYVTGLRSEPADPKNLQHIAFFATFVNTTGATANYRWCIDIWDPNNSKHSFGITSCRDSGAIPVGTNEIKAIDDTYRIVSGGQCLPLRGRAVWIDQNNARIPFTQPDKSIFWYNFQVCPVT